MIFSELTTYLAEKKCASLIDLAHRFGSDPGALRGMLSILERKGRVRKLPAGSACGSGCSKCDPTTIEIYEWVGAGTKR